MTAPPVGDYVLYATYGLEGLAISVGNGLLLLTILLEKSLRQRKEMLIIAGLCAADLFYGLGSLLLNVYRVILVSNDLQGYPYQSWYCVIFPPYFMANVGGQLTAVMNLVVSIDRYVAVAHPAKYRKLSTNYAKKVLACVAVFFVVTSTGMLAAVRFGTPIFATYTLMCLGAVFPRWYSLYEYFIAVIAGSLGVAIYIAIFFQYRRKMSKVTSTHAYRIRVSYTFK